jgi:hypothetical protein
MATWAVTANAVHPDDSLWGNFRVRLVTLTATGTYTASGNLYNTGDALTAASIGLDAIVAAFLNPDLSIASSTFAGDFGIPVYQVANSKIAIMTSGGAAATLTDMTNGTTITGMTIQAIFIGF